MVFPSIEFAVFFPIVLAISWALMSRPPLWKPFILAVSYVFYAAADPRFCLLLAGVTLGNQAGAQLAVRRPHGRTRTAIVTATVALDLGVLALFKYYGFFAEEVGGALDAVGLGLSPPLLSVALPVGLSFFTFQAISYVVDVHRGLCAPASTTDVAIYLSFFSHLVAGPIVRAREFLPQIASPRNPADVRIGLGVWLIGIGLVKKVLIADLLAREVVDPVFSVPEQYGGLDVLLAVYAFAAQIYCDFSGYTDIAIGLALLMGIVFPQNFDSPYRSASFGEFWRRWHMTLSRFLRDFLYIPLGGSRGGRWRTSRNLMITMLLGGLWHGAAWGFVLWGGIHGLALVVEHRFRGRGLLPTWLAWLITFHLVVLAWVPFRAPDLSLAGTVLGRLVEPGAATLWTPGAVLAIIAVIGLQFTPGGWWERVRSWLDRAHPATLGAGLAATVLVVGATVPGQGVPPFIYFAF